jgi:arginase family enzyme
MDLNGYFDPVSLDRPEIEYLDNKESFSHHISVHTPDHRIRELDRHRVAIIGLPEDRNGFIKGSHLAPNAVRNKLYQLAAISRDIKIYDLGNIKSGGSVNDSYFALRDVLLELKARGIVSLILGGSQDLSRGVFLALDKEPGLHHVLTIDSMLDFSESSGNLHSRNYLNQLLHPDFRERFSFTNLGHQAYFTTRVQMDQLEKSYLESIRLGVARSNMKLAEPLIRDSEYISIDLGSVRHSDAPGASIPSPNGFFGDELCQISRYAGLSEKVHQIGFFEFDPLKDVNDQTAHLTAQAAWYFLDGLAHRVRENPVDTPEHIKKFIVNLDAAGHDIIFHKSTLSERWWMEIPVKNPATNHNFFVSCSYEDYQLACKQEIPERWWRYLHRLGNESD